MKNKKGFTLVELLAVIVILGILALIIVPAISSYIVNTKDETYRSHETTMAEAAKSYTVECIKGNKQCTLPSKGSSTEIYLNELIEQEYIDKIKNPTDNKDCDYTNSYVIVKSVEDDYDYESCLYCGEYATKSPNCAGKQASEKDKVKPVCGEVTGGSTTWSKEPRTISVKCSDADSGCMRDSFSRTFTESATTGTITIRDKAKNTNECPVNVYIDRTEPTCELEVSGGQQEVNGWLSGQVTVRFKANSRYDANSGIATYGIGTSYNNRDYNKKESITFNNETGTTRVFGYVKDNVGNEGYCSVSVRTGIPRPKFDIYYGYQILPVKERYTTSGMSITEQGVVTTTSTSPKITFTGMNKYNNVKRIVLITDSSSLPSQETFKVKYDGRTTSAIKTGNRIEFELTQGTYNTYEFTLGNQSGKTINIKRLELEIATANVSTSKPVTVNLRPTIDTELIKVDKFSFNSGSSYQSEYYKEFNNTSGVYTGTAYVKNDIEMVSDPRGYSINQIDNVPPAINSFSPSTTAPTNQNITMTGQAIDSTSGIIEFAFSKNANLPFYSNEWQPISLIKSEITKQMIQETNYTLYFYVKDEAGNVSKRSYAVKNIDKIKPVCQAISGHATIKCSDSDSTDYSASGIVGWYFNKTNTTTGNYTGVTATTSLNVDGTSLVTTEGVYYLYVKDAARNISEVKSDTYWRINYNGNTGSTPTKTTDIKRNGQNIDLTPTSTKAGKQFKGWSESSTATSATSTIVASKATTLYAVFINCSKGTFNIGNSTACESCPSGYTSDPGISNINQCFINVADGKYKTTPTGTETINCAAGTAKAAHRSYYNSTDSCPNCTVGTYSAAGQAQCTNCPSGYTSVVKSTQISQCYISVPDGKYKTSPKGTETANCAAGTAKAAHLSYYNSSDSCSDCGVAQYSGVAAKACSNCPSGFTSAARSTAITQCYVNVSAGKYKTNANASGTTNCQGGTYSIAHTSYYGSNDACTTCPSGYTSNSGASALNRCYINVSAGKYIATANSATQTACPAGTSKPAHTVYYGNISICSGCTGGTYSTGGAGACTNCPSGYTSANKATAENQCYMSVAGGNYLVAKASSATSCPAGTYRSGKVNIYYGNSVSCSNCAANTYSTGGATSCTNCPSGYGVPSGSGKSQSSCYMSVAGGYYLTAKASSATSCPAGTYRSGTATVNYGNSVSCSNCAANTYSTGTAASCTNCPSGYGVASGSGKSQSSCYMTVSPGYYLNAKASSASKCGTGYYRSGSVNINYGNSVSCSKCPSGYTCSAGSTKIQNCYTAGTPSRWTSEIKRCSLTSYTYGFGGTSTSTVSSCSNNNISCDASHYNQVYTSCSPHYSYYFSDSTSTVSSCYQNTPFACNSSNYGYSYQNCTTNYSYSFGGTSTSTVSSCSSNPISCNSSNVGKTWVSCSPNYNYYFSSATTQNVSSCSTVSFTCNASNYGRTATSCSARFTYQFGGSSTTYVSSCSSSSFTCNSSNVGRTKVSCTYQSSGTHKGKYKKVSQKCNKTAAGSIKTSKTCTRSLSNYTKTSKTCNKNISNYTKTTRQCTRKVYNYTKTTKTCSRTPNYGFVDGTMTNQTYCTPGPNFVCQANKVNTYYITNCITTGYSCPSGTTLNGSNCYHN